MALASLNLRGFRNLQNLSLDLDPEANYLFGPNGAGKTNLLEAIHYLAIGRSFRGCRDADLPGFDAELLVCAGRDAAGREAEVRFDRREKRVTLGGARIERLSDFLGWLPVVVLLLEDIELSRGGPGVRRGFVDMAIAKADRGYITVLGAFRRALAQRNRLLEQEAGGTATARDSAGAWEEELVRAGVLVYAKRAPLVGRLLGPAGEFAARLTGMPVEFEWRPAVSQDGDVAADFRRRLDATRARSLALGRVLVGPHRDDVAISARGRDLRRFGSVGEQRLCGIALRLAEAELIGGARVRPTFLLDEVASELDEVRSRLVMELVGVRGQVVYAAARPLAAGARRPAAKEFRVEQGKVLPVPAAG